MVPEFPSEVPRPPLLTGDEILPGTSASVRDFWAFAMSDLRTNNTRGYLAEFLVQLAVGRKQARVEWDPYDVVTDDGIRIEVKAAAYLQAWIQRAPSKITFSGLSSRTWDPLAGYAKDRTYNADVYAFCVQRALTHEDYNALDVGQWLFYVVPAWRVAMTGQRSLRLSSVSSLAGGPTSFEDLNDAIHDAHQIDI